MAEHGSRARTIAVVTARGGSKGLPGKNIRPFCGKPLIAWTIEHGLQSPSIDDVVVSTDSAEIAQAAREHGAQVPFIRPAELASDMASSIDVVLHVLDFLEAAGNVYDRVVLLEPTSPLREVSDIEGAIRLLDEGLATSVVGVAKVEAGHPAFLFEVDRGLLRPMTGAQPTGLRRQSLRGEYFYLEGSVYASRVDVIRARRSFYHEETAPWVVDRYKAVEIDELADFIAAEALMKAKLEGLLT